MPDPDLKISPEAIEHVSMAVEAWDGDIRDLGLALSAMGHALLLILDGRSDHIELYERAAQTVALLGDAKGQS